MEDRAAPMDVDGGKHLHTGIVATGIYSWLTDVVVALLVQQGLPPTAQRTRTMR